MFHAQEAGGGNSSSHGTLAPLTPEWNQNWYTIKYDANKNTKWMPLAYKNSYIKDHKCYIEYTAEIDFVNSSIDYTQGQHYKDADGNSVDENNKVVSNQIITYKIAYDTPEDKEGHVVFDKASFSFKAGDKIRFYALEIDLEKNNAFKADAESWNETSALITLTQPPTFSVEKLEFTDKNDKDFDYFYAMIAEDASGNIAVTNLQKTK